MVPLRLSLKNFMCYRDNVPPLDLSGIQIACLCGDNGHGKTALLDAMTWALWGQSRARTQEELVHQGEQDMAVELQFLARDQLYRVSRKHSRSARGRQGKTLLELQVSSGNGFRPITGNSVRETEAQIRELLHMDYETFVNTAFLLQGEADRFTRSQAARRKEILAEVLDLSYYQRLEEKAKRRSRDIQEGIREAEASISLHQREIDRAPELRGRLAGVSETLAEIAPEEEVQRRKVDEVRAAVESMQSKRDEIDAIGKRLNRARDDVAEVERRVSSHEAGVRELEAVLHRDAEVREQFAKLAGLRQEVSRLDEASFQCIELERRKAKMESEIAVERERLAGQIAQVRKAIAEELEPGSKRLPDVEQALRDAESEQSRLDEAERAIKEQQGQAREADDRVRQLEEANARLKEEMESTRQKFDLLQLNEAECPLCRQALGPEGKDHLRREYEAHGRDAKQQFRDNAVERVRVAEALMEQTAQLSGQEATLHRERRELQGRTAILERELAQCREARSQLGPALTEAERVERRLADGEFATEQRAGLAEVDARIGELDYDRGEHQRLQEQVKQLDPYAELHRKLVEAADSLPREREALQTSVRMLDRRRQEVREAEEQRATLEGAIGALPQLASELTASRGRLRALEEKRQNAEVEQAVVAQQLDRIARLETEAAQKDKARRELAEERRIYDELVVAFGKNGIQALIIETAIPQLQDDANELLARLTESRMSVKLESHPGRRDSRTGLPTEELQILIADEVGTRSYETFSGGETFRVNFALRIALSKLLARRSGAPLPTLFMDEGFGSQDSVGQERLKEAIQSIQGDFEKVLVITHVDQVKEAFPTRIEVTKTPEGSTFEVI